MSMFCLRFGILLLVSRSPRLLGYISPQPSVEVNGTAAVSSVPLRTKSVVWFVVGGGELFMGS